MCSSSFSFVNIKKKENQTAVLLRTDSFVQNSYKPSSTDVKQHLLPIWNNKKEIILNSE